ncbi:MAG: hypothetical protein JNJ55_10655, partial [Betaproteobacteria bacterium]|nr:hypothetical protein [Betaproteobacteria bacterium]
MARLRHRMGHWRLGLVGALAGTVSATPAASLNPQVEVRSALGSVLDARIDAGLLDRVSPDGECFGLAHDTIEPKGVELGLTVIEVRGRRTLKLESRDAITAPRVRVTLTAGCIPATRISLTFELTLKPMAAIAQAPMPAPALADTKRFADPGVAVVARPGDSLASLARLIYPLDAARQAQFIASLRNHNPELASMKAEEVFAPGLNIIFPDLRDLSGIAPQQTLAQSTAKQPAKPGPRVAARTGRESSSAPPVPSPKTRTTPSNAPSAPGTATAKEKPFEPSPQTRTSGASQMLRLSTPEIDTSRSARVSQEQRAAIRQRRLILDADDQMAAILNLQNAVRQLESRLQALAVERKSPAEKDAPAAPAATPQDSVQLKAAQRVEPTPVKAPTAVKPVEAPAESVPTKPQPATLSADANVAPAKPPVAPKPKAEPVAAAEAPLWVDPTWLGAAALALLVLVGGWFWSRRAPRKAVAKETPPVKNEDAAIATPPVTRGDVIDDALSDSMPAGPATESPAMQETMRMAAHPVDTPRAADIEVNHADDNSTARFDLDPTPAASLDLALDDRPDEDRVRRLQYMYVRFPELMSRTVSIDDADSVINAARLYYEESQADRACELLTFGVEERPQEVRFWLAQFEIFRLENRAADFSALAAKFHVLFSYAPAWPKVRHIGHELDPAN